ncbi:hypothetical protein [Desulfopila inferna]|uniref:hypothetical protein n=1 Tax=Desulfopila inferna TaxID=468528 RepID=UPI001964AC6C|nr:hypothetical protein [Desulfopila inferna]MBM9604168.1 hypothetical protein [Desulfopila inferna]
MPGSIESFVKKLQAEGVDAGKEAAEKIIEDARNEAGKIIASAEAEAERIAAKAKNDADSYFSRMQTELEFAVRDSILKLRETITQILSSTLTRKIDKHLSNPDYLVRIIKEVIIAYAKSDAAQQACMEINISDTMDDEFKNSLIKDILQNIDQEHERIKFQATLSKAGFEYTIDGATVEVSPESVAELISEMVGPVLQEMIDRVVDDSEKA